MKSYEPSVQSLARLIYGPGGAAVSSREDMEAILLPAIRVALHSGRGAPALVKWVQQHLPAVAPAWPMDRTVDPVGAAPRLARLLLSDMLAEVRPDPVWTNARETLASL